MTIDALDLFGDPSILKVSATDIASASSCPRHLAVKIRPDVKSRRWRRSFGSEKTFVLGIVTDLVRAAHSSEWAHDPQHLAGWIAQELERRRIHRLLRPYATVAVTNILEAHWDIEDEIGPLQLFQSDPSIGHRRAYADGVGPALSHGRRRSRDPPLPARHGSRRTRRLRTCSGPTRPLRSQPAIPSRDTPVRIRVVEIGAADGSITVLFDGSPAEADAEFSAEAKHVAGSLGDLADATPGFECASCKVAGACEALIPVPEVLGQPIKGYASRSVAPSDLDRYQRCPAQWLLASDLNLPTDPEYSGAQTRGLLVHTWLEAAHARGVGCSDADLPAPGGDIGLAATVMDAADYAIAHPYLRHHVSSCPLATDGVEYVASETAIHGFDHDAEVIAVTKPDLVFRVGDRLVAREVKTTGDPAGRRGRRHLCRQPAGPVPALDAGRGRGRGARLHDGDGRGRDADAGRRRGLSRGTSRSRGSPRPSRPTSPPPRATGTSTRSGARGPARTARGVPYASGAPTARSTRTRRPPSRQPAPVDDEPAPF